MLGDKYILEPEAIIDHSVLPGGKRMYLVKWKPKWVKKSELPPGVFDKWESKKAKRAKMDPENPSAEDEAAEEEEGFRILKERRVKPGELLDDEMNAEEGDEDEDGEEEDGEEEDEDGEEDDEELDEDGEELDEEDLGDVEIKEEEEEEEKYADKIDTLSSIDRDIVLNELPGQADVKTEEEIKKEEEDDVSISIPPNGAKAYS